MSSSPPASARISWPEQPIPDLPATLEGHAALRHRMIPVVARLRSLLRAVDVFADSELSQGAAEVAFGDLVSAWEDLTGLWLDLDIMEPDPEGVPLALELAQALATDVGRARTLLFDELGVVAAQDLARAERAQGLDLDEAERLLQLFRAEFLAGEVEENHDTVMIRSASSAPGLRQLKDADSV